MTRNLLSILILLLPAAYAWWSGRRLLGRLDDPLFPDLHFARILRLGTVSLLSMVAGVAVSVELAWPKLLVAAFALAVAEHGYRKRVYDETWSVLGYVGHFLRLLGALFGTWILIGFTPNLVAGSGAAAVPVAIAIAATILGLSLFSAPLVGLLLGATPLAHSDRAAGPGLLPARFEKVLARASCRRPAVLRAGPAGGFWINAMALPSLGRPAVILSDDLLACLGPREVTAIFAHEVAHLEMHLRGWRLAAGHLVLWAFTATALAVPFVVGPSIATAFIALWPLAVLMWLGFAASRSRVREHQSDLRALELCGDAPALIDALTKLHALSRQPRHWGLHSEAGMTHPSLAQRLRAVRDAAIRDAAATEAPGFTPGISEAAADRSTRSLWVRLLALPMIVLGFVPASGATLSLASLLVLIRPAAATLAAAGAIAIAAALVGARDLAAPSGGETAPSTVGFLFLAGIYLLALGLRRYRARLAEPRWVTWGGLGLLAVSAALSAVGGVARLAQPHPADELHRWAREGPGPALLLVGLAAMLLTVRRRAARFAAALALVAVAGWVVVSGSWFRDRFGSDPFNLPAPRLAVEEPPLEKVRGLRLPQNPRQLVLSPSGRLAYSTDFPGFGSWRGRDGFEVELVGGGFVHVAALAVEFIDDQRLAALEISPSAPQGAVQDISPPAPRGAVADGAMVLRILRLAAEPVAELTVTLPALTQPRLRLDPGGERWEVVGETAEGGEMVRLTGGLDGAWKETARVALPQVEGNLYEVLPLLTSAGRLLTVDHHYAAGGPRPDSWAGTMLVMLSGTAITSRIVAAGASQPPLIVHTSRTVRCFEPAFAQRSFLCATLGGGDARLWSIRGERPVVEPIGELEDMQNLGGATTDGRLLLSSHNGPMILVDPGSAKAWRIGRQLLAEPLVAEVLRSSGGKKAEGLALLGRYGAPVVALRSGLMAVAVLGREGSPVLVYRVPGSI